MNRLFLGLPFLLVASSLFAQEVTPSDAEAAGAAFAGLGCSCIIMIVALAIQIALGVWVYKDAKKRGMDNAVLFCIITLLTGLIGLIIYLLMRPKDVPPGGTAV